jgi:hypothetical protein
MLWLRWVLVGPPPQANCSTIMPGAPMASRRATTSGVMTPRSSARMGTCPSPASSAANSSTPGPFFQVPTMAARGRRRGGEVRRQGVTAAGQCGGQLVPSCPAGSDRGGNEGSARGPPSSPPVSASAGTAQ